MYLHEVMNKQGTVGMAINKIGGMRNTKRNVSSTVMAPKYLQKGAMMSKK